MSLQHDGECLERPHGYTSPLVELVPHNDTLTLYNVTARQHCSFNFTVKADNQHGLARQAPRNVTVTATDSGQYYLCSIRMKSYFFGARE